MSGQSVKMGFAVASLVVLAGVLGILVAMQQQEPETAIPGLLWPDPKELAPFAAVDHENNPFSLADLRGKWSFLFFGYTHCPDICPVTLAVIDKVQRQLDQQPDRQQAVQTVFVSVDPERDVSTRLDQYVGHFNPGFIGVSGSVEQIAGLTGQIGVAYFPDKTEDSENYLVDHSASLFLIDPRGRLVAIFSAPHDKQDIIGRFNRIRAFIEGQLA